MWAKPTTVRTLYQTAAAAAGYCVAAAKSAVTSTCSQSTSAVARLPNPRSIFPPKSASAAIVESNGMNDIALESKHEQHETLACAPHLSVSLIESRWALRRTPTPCWYYVGYLDHTTPEESSKENQAAPPDH